MKPLSAIVFYSSPEPNAPGELTGLAGVSRRHLSSSVVVDVVVSQHFQTLCPLKPQVIQAQFHLWHLLAGELKFFFILLFFFYFFFL